MVSCASVFERKKGKLRGGESNPGLDGVVNCYCVDNVALVLGATDLNDEGVHPQPLPPRVTGECLPDPFPVGEGVRVLAGLGGTQTVDVVAGPPDGEEERPEGPPHVVL